MVRKLGIAVFGVGSLLPSIAGAFGLGEITLKSALNQPLEAEIKLTKVGDLSKSEVLPKLATHTDFERAGVDRVHFLTDIRFDVTMDGEGGGIINIKTSKPVREPFLNFIIEVQWPQGKLLREYTVLLDPPVFSEKAPAQVTPPQGQYQTVPTAPTAKQPPVTITPPSALATPPVNQTGQGTSTADSSQTSQLASSAPQTYGRTQRDDNLWNIAEQVRPSTSVNIQQTMVAIQALNPDAFIDGNINLLKRGQILRVPTLEQIRDIGSRNAIQEVGQQNRRWRELLSSKSGQAPIDAPQLGSGLSSSPMGEAENQQSRLKIIAANEGQQELSESAAIGSRDGSGGSAKVSALQEELALSEEKVDSLVLENKELNNRVSALEEQIQTSEHILELKDNQIAAMQAKLIVLEKQIKESLGEEALAELSSEDISEINKGITPDLAVNQEQDIDSSADQPELSAEGADELAPADSAQQDNGASADTADIATAAKTVELPVAQRSAVEEITEKLLSNPMYLAAGAGVVALLAIGLVSARRKKTAEAASGDAADVDFEDFEDLEAMGSAEEEGAEQGLGGGLDGDLDSAQVGDFADDSESEDGEESAQQEAVKGELGDAIGEADIYIAYGRYAHAIDLLKQAAEAEPERADIKLKLLEVYAETDDAQAFAAVEQELTPVADDLTELKIAEYRENLSSPVDGASAAAMPSAEADADPAQLEDDQALADEFAVAEDFGQESELPSAEVEADAGAEAPSLDFDLDLDGDQEIAQLESELQQSEDDSEPELDVELEASEEDLDDALGGLDFDSESSSDLDALELGVDTTSEAAEDFNFELEQDPAVEFDEQSEQQPSASEDTGFDVEVSLAEDGLDNELEMLDSSAEQAASDEIEPETESAVEDVELDFSLDGELDAAVDLEQDNDAGLDLEFDIDSGDGVSSELAETASANADGVLDLADEFNEDSSADAELQIALDESIEEVAAADDAQLEIEASNEDMSLDETEQLETEIAEIEEDLKDVEDFSIDDAELSAQDGESSTENESAAADLDLSGELESSAPDNLEVLATETASENSEVESADADEAGSNVFSMEDDEEFAFLADTDEAATKLDLARAYIDMGDKDGAKDILQEVLTEGNDVQKQDASELLALIA